MNPLARAFFYPQSTNIKSAISASTALSKVHVRIGFIIISKATNNSNAREQQAKVQAFVVLSDLLSAQFELNSELYRATIY